MATTDTNDTNKPPAHYGRRLPKDPPLVMGGQGRTPRDVVDGGMALAAYTAIALVAVAIIGAIYWVTR